MSIKGAVGLQGHGKTYETVKFAIVPAVAKKRRVVTNIRGLDHEKICEYLIAKSQNGGGPAQAGGSCSDGSSPRARGTRPPIRWPSC